MILLFLSLISNKEEGS